MTVELAVDIYIKVIFSADVCKFSFKERVKLFYADDLVKSLQELQRQLFGKWKRCTYFQELEFLMLSA